MRLFLILLLSVLGACADPAPVLARKTSTITIVEVKGLTTLGRATWTEKACYIALREYPTCLAHEVRHCLEGQWHGNRENHDDCR